MIKLSRTEIRWIMNFVRHSRDNSQELMQYENNKFRELHKLEFENMSDLYNKLKTALDNRDKRIEIYNG